MALGAELKRLGKHSAIYGLGGLVSRILAVLLLPLYTRYLSTSDYGVVETLIALTTVVGIALSAGIGSAFFRFYFDSNEPAARRRVLRTSFWFIMGMATLGLVVGVAFASELSQFLFGTTKDAKLVAASFVGLWAGMNWAQLTNLFRVEERSVAFVSASVANILVTVGATLILVVALDKGPIGVIVGNFTGTLAVYSVLVFYRREQLGLEFDRKLLRQMNRFGLPLVPTALFLWVTNFSDRIFLAKLADTQRSRPLLGRRAHRVRDGSHAHGVQARMARVRVLDRGRRRGPAHVRVRPDLRDSRHHLGRDRAGPALSVDRAVDRGARVRGVVARRRPAGVLGRRVRRLHRRRDRRRPRQADAVQLGRDRSGRGREHRAQPDPDPAVRDDGRRHRDDRRLRGDVRRDGVVVAADLPASPTSGAAS